jgi:hypothetical protein
MSCHLLSYDSRNGVASSHRTARVPSCSVEQEYSGSRSWGQLDGDGSVEVVKWEFEIARSYEGGADSVTEGCAWVWKVLW